MVRMEQSKNSVVDWLKVGTTRMARKLGFGELCSTVILEAPQDTNGDVVYVYA